MIAVLLVFASLSLLTLGIMMVVAAAALPPQRFRTARSQAEEKSLALLRSWLTPEQLKQWTRGREFEVTGCDTGNRYLISDTTSVNILQLAPSGDAVAKWCFAPKGSLVMGDVLLAQKVALETMERQTLAVANSYRVTPQKLGRSGSG
jgi:hypothetical protein